MKNVHFLPQNNLLEYNDRQSIESVNTYLEAEREINKLFFYTKNVCKNSCHKKPTGCCNYNWYNCKIPNNKIGKMFKIMRKPLPQSQGENICKFFSPKRGCILGNLKSPVCIGMLCPTLCAMLKADFGVIYNSYEYINFFEGILKKTIKETHLREHRIKVGKMLYLIEHKLEKDKKCRTFWVEE